MIMRLRASWVPSRAISASQLTESRSLDLVLRCASTTRKTGSGGNGLPDRTPYGRHQMTSTKTDLFAHYKGLVAQVTETGDTAYTAATETYVAADSGDKARMRAYVTKTGQAEMV